MGRLANMVFLQALLESLLIKVTYSVESKNPFRSRSEIVILVVHVLTDVVGRGVVGVSDPAIGAFVAGDIVTVVGVLAEGATVVGVGTIVVGTTVAGAVVVTFVVVGAVVDPGAVVLPGEVVETSASFIAAAVLKQIVSKFAC